MATIPKPMAHQPKVFIGLNKLIIPNIMARAPNQNGAKKNPITAVTINTNPADPPRGIFTQPIFFLTSLFTQDDPSFLNYQ